MHGLPETAALWGPLRAVLDEEAVAVALPGLGAARPDSFLATKDAYAAGLAGELAGFDKPVDVVAHDLGALLTLRVVTVFDIPVRSWVVDVANIFHLSFRWPARVHEVQTPGVGEQMLEIARRAAPDDPRGTAARLAAGGVGRELAIATRRGTTRR